VFGGTKQQAQLYAAGLLMGVPKALVNPLKIRGEQRSSTSNLYMLPAEKYWPTTDVIAKTKTRSYGSNDIDQFLKDVGFPEGAAIALMDTTPGVPIHCFYGMIKKSTVETLEYDDDADFPDKPSNLIMGDGDGTVNHESLRLCGAFQSKQAISVKEIPDVDHTGLISEKSVMSDIGQLVK